MRGRGDETSGGMDGTAEISPISKKRDCKKMESVRALSKRMGTGSSFLNAKEMDKENFE